MFWAGLTLWAARFRFALYTENTVLDALWIYVSSDNRDQRVDTARSQLPAP